MSQIVEFSFHYGGVPEENVANDGKVADFLRNMEEFLKKMSQVTSLPAAKLRKIPIIFQVLK